MEIRSSPFSPRIKKFYFPSSIECATTRRLINLNTPAGNSARRTLFAARYRRKRMRRIVSEGAIPPDAIFAALDFPARTGEDTQDALLCYSADALMAKQ